MSYSYSESSITVRIHGSSHWSPGRFFEKGLVDMGGLGQSLLFYDKVIVQIGSAGEIACVVDWFEQSKAIEDFLAMLIKGELFFHCYSEFDDLSRDDRIDKLLRLDRKDAEQLPNGSMCRSKSGLRKLRELLNTSLIVTSKSAWPQYDNGVARDQASLDRLCEIAESYKEVLEIPDYSLLKRLYDSKGFKRTEAELQALDPRERAIQELITAGCEHFIQAEDMYQYIMLSGVSGSAIELIEASKFTKSHIHCSEPISSVIRDVWTVDTDIETMDKPSQLYKSVTFPDIQAAVNQHRLSSRQIMNLRKQGTRFREWFHSLDGESDILHDFYFSALQSGSIRDMKSTVDIGVSVLLAAGGTALGGLLEPNLGAIVGGAIGASSKEIVTKFWEGSKTAWSPGLFGKKIRENLQE